MKFKLALFAGTIALMTGALPAPAHHSFAGTYLEDAEPVKIEGELKAFLIRNPHSFVHVEDPKLKNPDGTPVRWSVDLWVTGWAGLEEVNRPATWAQCWAQY